MSGVGVLDKAVVILAACVDGASLAELVERTKLPRATAHRLAQALEIHRMLVRDTQGRWRPGPAPGRAGQRRARRAADRGRAAAHRTARRHRRERAALPAPRRRAGLRGRRRTRQRPARHRAGRLGAADDGRLGRADPARLGAAGGGHAAAAPVQVHRPHPGRGAPPRLGAERRRARGRCGQRLGARSATAPAGSSPRSASPARSSGSAAAPATGTRWPWSAPASASPASDATTRPPDAQLVAVIKKFASIRRRI